MARRRRSFGYSAAKHRAIIRDNAPHLRRLVKRVRDVLADGNCNQAIRTLAAASYNAGRMRADRLGAGQRVMSGTIGATIMKLSRRVAAKCSR